MPTLQAAARIEQAVPFFWVRDMEASSRFFQQGLGFTQRHEWVEDGRLRWCWLSRDGASVMLQEISGEGLERGISTAAAADVAIYFLCSDARLFHREVTSRGVSAPPPSVSNAMWITEVQDPDGRRLYFESPANDPDGTTIS